MLGFPKHGGKDEENLTHFFRHYLPYCIRWLPYAVGRQPYCAGGCNKEIGAQKGCFLRPLPFVLDFEVFVGGEK